MTLNRAVRWATVIITGWAAASLATNRRHTVSYSIDRTSAIHPAAPYAIWTAIAVIAVFHGHEMRRYVRGLSA